MLIRTAALTFAGIAALAACAPTTPPAPECGSDVTHRTHDGSTIVFVVRRLTIDPDDLPENPHTGFDLDGFASTDSDANGCAHPDFLSALDPESNCSAVDHDARCTAFSAQCSCRDTLNFGGSGCVGAVDNQLPTIANTLAILTSPDIRASVSDDVGSGRVVILARITGIDAFDDDPEVHVQLFNGFAAPGTACTSPTLDARYQIDVASLRAGGTTEADFAVDLVGAIHQGRLRAAGGDADAFTISFPFAELPFRFELRHLMIAADLTPEGATNGNFGGWVDGQTLGDEFVRIAPEYEGIVRGIVAGMTDLSVNGLCSDSTASPARIGRVGFGLGFDLVRATIDPNNPVVAAALPGTCGAPRD